MHAFLITGSSSQQSKTQIQNLAKKLNTKIFEFSLQKIEDVRNLNNLIRLSFNEPTLIVCEDIHNASEEALNAFLKNLEEPQENIYFALTAASQKKVLPTIVSRCQIIKSGSGEKNLPDKDVEKFLEMTTGEKFSYVDKIKDRQVALKLVEDTVNILHGNLSGRGVKYTDIARHIEIALETYSRLKLNGNVNLQLSNFVIQYGKS